MSNLYFTGLGSGIDTDAMVTYLMELERLPLARVEAQKKELRARESCWQEIRGRLVDLERSLRELQRDSLYRQKVATVDREGQVKVAAAPGAAPGSYQLEILALAQAHTIASFSAAEIGRSGGDGTAKGLGLAGSLWIDGIETVVAEGDSLRDICDRINALEEIGITAAMIDRRLVLTRNETGATEIEIGDNDLSRALGLLVEKEPGSEEYLPRTIQEAREARLKLNGLEVTRSSNLIDDLLEGVTFNLQQSSGEPLTLTISGDRLPLIDRIEEFIRHYNSTYRFIKAQTAVDPEAGTRGTLYGESSLNQILASIRRTVTGALGADGEYNCLAAIGINTAAWGSAEPEGTLLLDRSRLNAALEADPGAVAALLSGEQGAVGRLEGYLGGLTRSGEGLIHYRSEGIGRRIRELDRRAAMLDSRLEKREQTLRQQFLAAERVIGQMNSQGAWLDQQLALMTRWTASESRSG